jgi:pimeloyl-ACP methyl ester carboxylesterase
MKPPIPPGPDPLTGNAYTHRRPDGRCLQGRRLAGNDPLLVFVHGFRSQHRGNKAEAIARFAAGRGLGCLRLDLLGHGHSDGTFPDFRVSEAVRDVQEAIAALSPAAVVLIGSSLGALIALRLAQGGGLPVKGLLCIAPACHFISRNPAAQNASLRLQLQRQGYIEAFDPDRQQPYRIPQAMIDDALACEPAPGPIDMPLPVRLVHGTEDASVPHAESEDLHRRIPGSTLRLVEGGDHRLNRHLPLILDELEALLSAIPSASATTR